MITLDKCSGIHNTLSELSGRTCVPNETDDVNLSLFNLLTRGKESRTLIKHISCKCKFDSRKCNLNQL